MSIRHISFKHGWFYHYRLHDPKTDSLCNGGIASLRKYLDMLFTDCPEEPFSTALRSSSLKFDLGIHVEAVEGHEVSRLAREGLDWAHYKTAHSNVQVYMLQNDTFTLGVEVPLWMHSNELEGYSALFDSDEPLSGHIDVLSVEDGKIWIWDYKPKASKEKYATTQVYFYALMMSKRTGIPLDEFRCGYFDEDIAYVFKPELKYVSKFSEVAA